MLLTRFVRRFSELLGVVAPSQGGLPAGGSPSQVLAKASGSDYDTHWADGGVAIGGTIASGTAGRVLYEGDGPVVADSDSLQFTASAGLRVTGIAAGVVVKNAVDDGVSTWLTGLRAGDDAVVFRAYYGAGTVRLAYPGQECVFNADNSGITTLAGTTAVDVLAKHQDSSGARLAFGFNTTGPLFDFGGTTQPGGSMIRVTCGSSATAGVIILGASGQAAPLLSVQGPSSTGTARDLGYIDAGFTVSTDATYTGYVDVDANDHGGRRNGLRVASDGTQALLGFYGAAPVAKAAAPTTLADAITILRNLGFCS